MNDDEEVLLSRVGGSGVLPQHFDSGAGPSRPSSRHSSRTISRPISRPQSTERIRRNGSRSKLDQELGRRSLHMSREDLEADREVRDVRE